ncbi:hypothetical protein ACP70R_003289 [Stipagrostis hirtigluma subsp. patula]
MVVTGKCGARAAGGGDGGGVAALCWSGGRRRGHPASRVLDRMPKPGRAWPPAHAHDEAKPETGDGRDGGGVLTAASGMASPCSPSRCRSRDTFMCRSTSSPIDAKGCAKTGSFGNDSYGCCCCCHCVVPLLPAICYRCLPLPTAVQHS